MTLDIDFVRAQFPAFSDPALKDLAFFESAGGSFPCRFVVERLERFYRERKVQPYWYFGASRVGGEEMDEARSRLAAIMGVDTDELSFGPSTTQNTYVLAQAFRQWMSPGDAIIVTNQDHEANSGPWRRLADEGFEVREWQMREDGSLQIEDLAKLLDDKVRLVAFPHCSNVVADINDVAAITKVVHDAGAVVCVDGVSYAPHGLPDVGALGADIYLFSAYKTYGPHQGIMVMRRALGEALPNQGHEFNADALEKRFTPAGPDHAQIAASAGMADYVDTLFSHLGLPHQEARGRGQAVHTAMRDREIALLTPLLNYVSAKNSVRLIGPSDPTRRAPTVTLVAEKSGLDLAALLATHDIGAGGGDFYSVRPLNALGVDLSHGALRVSFTHYTSEAEISRLIRALDHVL